MPNELVVREKISQTKTYNPVKFIKAYKKNLYLDNWKKKIAKLPNYIIKKENKDYSKISMFMEVMKFGIIKILSLIMMNIIMVRQIKDTRLLMQ